VDIEEEWQKKGDGEVDDMSTVLENVKRSELSVSGNGWELTHSQSCDSGWIRADWNVGRRVGHEA
jgi:hypothetical protein